VARHGLKDALVSMHGIEVCGEAATGPDTIRLVEATKPDLVILDLSLPDLNGFEVARTIRATLPETDVLVLTHHESAKVARAAMRTGARGYLTKSCGQDEIATAVDQIRHKKFYVTKELAAKLRKQIRKMQMSRSAPLAVRTDPRLTSEELATILKESEKKVRQEALAILREAYERRAALYQQP
jgi:DNA-binding NarL/FixJ family response regulator